MTECGRYPTDASLPPARCSGRATRTRPTGACPLCCSTQTSDSDDLDSDGSATKAVEGGAIAEEAGLDVGWRVEEILGAEEHTAAQWQQLCAPMRSRCVDQGFFLGPGSHAAGEICPPSSVTLLRLTLLGSAWLALPPRQSLSSSLCRRSLSLAMI